MNYKEFGDRGVNALPAIAGFLIISGFNPEEWLGAFYFPMYWGTLATSIGILIYAVLGLSQVPHRY